MSDESLSNEDVVEIFESAAFRSFKYHWTYDGTDNKALGLTEAERSLRRARAAVLSRMSSPSHDRATPVVYDTECSRMLGVVGAYLHRLQGVSEPTTVRLAGYAQDYARKLSERLADNELAQDRAMAEGGWQPINDQTPTNRSVLIYIPNAEHYGPGIYRAILVDMGTGRRWHTTGFAVGRDLTGDVTPTHWMHTPAPPTPTTKEETA